MSIDQPLTRLDLGTWDRDADRHDRRLLDHCVGPTLDVGCGPGRLTAELAARGEVVLGIDVSEGAVALARDRGGPALLRDVFDALPGEGRWGTALLADGNVGIGGDPASLLSRLSELLADGGRVVVELSPPGTPHTDDWAILETADDTRVIRWSVVGADAIDDLAHRTGFAVTERTRAGSRWWAVLTKEEQAA
jgi:SAM-dependent methyltransferase